MGILEQILADVGDLRREVAALRAQIGNTASNAAQQPVQQFAQPVQQQPVQQQPVQQQQPQVEVTDKMIEDLITPHVGNDQIKAALGNQMRGMGINSMPEIPTHRYAEVYQAFKNVLAQFGIGGAAQQPVQQAPVSII